VPAEENLESGRRDPAPVPEPRGDRRRAWAEALLVFAVSAVATGIAMAGVWTTSQQSLHQAYQDELIKLAAAAAVVIDPALHEEIRDPAQRNGPDYLRAVEPLRRLRESVGANYIYTVVRDGSHVRFVLDAALPGDGDGDGVEDQSNVWQIYDAPDPAMLAALGDGAKHPGVAAATEEPYSDEWGSFMTGYAPLIDATGRQIGAVGVDIDASVYIERLAVARGAALGGVIPAVLMLLVLSSGFFSARRREFAAVRRATAAADEAERAVALLRFEQERLKDSEARFRALFELAPVGMALGDLETGKYIEVNDALLAPTGHTREELLNRSHWDFVPEEGMPAARERIQSLRDTGRFGPIERDFVRKDGSICPVLASGTAMREPSGRIVVWSILQDISERKALESSLAKAARLDKLTGLANRAVLMERLHAAVERVRQGEQTRFAVLFLDFDRFKLLNDTLGHDAGDELLQQVAKRLQRSLRATDAMSDSKDGNVIARFGGDEFVILINDLDHEDDAVRIADRLLRQLEPGYVIKGRNIHSTASIGIVTSDQSAESADAIVRNADVAMYEAKRAGRARSVVFSETMHARLARQVMVEHDLREALTGGQFWLAYQPIVDLETGQMVSTEALLRWNHPILGELSPGEFISVAEESGLIVPIGDWVLEEACRQMSEWRRTPQGASLRVISVNLSRVQLALGEQLFDRVMQLLARYSLPPSSLQLEVTEYEVMRDPVAAKALMERLRAAGVRLAIDDFGTGTSSLACLRDYPFDTVKIAREFLTDLSAGVDVLAVLHATTTLVTNLGKVSVAEGVEHAAHVPVLQSLGCQFAQGYLFGRPVRAAELFAAPSAAQIDRPSSGVG
jgi:diguanylate cyclase (GGDEF)-like protein/PAS domain S-box-containing protein